MRAIIVEDNFLIALDLEEHLRAAGVDLLVAATVAEADALVDGFDIALVDIKLPDGSGYDLARRLVALGKRIVFTTGSRPKDCPPDLEHWPFLVKPYRPEDLSRALGFPEPGGFLSGTSSRRVGCS